MTKWLLQVFEDSKSIDFDNYHAFLDEIDTIVSDDAITIDDKNLDYSVFDEIERTFDSFKEKESGVDKKCAITFF